MRVFVDSNKLPQQVTAVMLGRIGKDAHIYRNDWVCCRTYKEFREIVKNNIARITHVSFGSDLNDMDDPTQTDLTCAYGMGMIEDYEIPDSYDALVYLIDYCGRTGYRLPHLLIHRARTGTYSAMEALVKRTLKRYERAVFEDLSTF